MCLYLNGIFHHPPTRFGSSKMANVFPVSLSRMLVLLCSKLSLVFSRPTLIQLVKFVMVEGYVQVERTKPYTGSAPIPDTKGEVAGEMIVAAV